MGDTIQLNTLEDVLIDARDLALAQYKTKKNLPLIFLGYRPDGEKIVIPLIFSNEHEKAMGLQTVKLLFGYHRVNQYAVISECWIAHSSVDTPLTCRVSEHPDKKEIVMVLAVNRKGVKQKIYDISEDRQLQENPLSSSGSFGGTFTELLMDRELTTLEKQEIASLIRYYYSNHN